MRRAGPAMAALLLLAASRTTSGAEPARLRFAVCYPEALANGPLDGRLLLLISKDAAARAALPDQRQRADDASRSSASTSTGWKPGARRRLRRRACSAIPVAQPGGRAGRHVPRPGAAAPVRDVPPRRRPHGEAADGPRRRPAVEPRAGQPLQRRRSEVAIDPGDGGDDRDRRSTRSSRRSRRRRHEVRQARADPERAAHEVLGPADVPRRARPAARRLRRAPERALSRSSIYHGHFPHTIDGFREEPPDPNLKPEYSRALPPRRATTGSSRSTPTSSTRTGPARTSRACSSSRSSTPTRTTTTPTR